MINIVSKDNYRIQISNKIVELAKGLEPYPQDKEIIFDDIVTSDFLKAFKQFYEENQFDVSKMKMQKPVSSKEVEKYLGKTLGDLMQPFIDSAIKDKKLDIFIPFIQGAHLFQAKHFIEFVNCCLAIVIQYKGLSEYDIKQFQKDWNLKEYSESQFHQCFVSKLQNKYIQLLQTKEGDQQIQQIQMEEDLFGEEW